MIGGTCAAVPKGYGSGSGSGSGKSTKLGAVRAARTAQVIAVAARNDVNFVTIDVPRQPGGRDGNLCGYFTAKHITQLAMEGINKKATWQGSLLGRDFAIGSIRNTIGPHVLTNLLAQAGLTAQDMRDHRPGAANCPPRNQLQKRNKWYQLEGVREAFESTRTSGGYMTDDAIWQGLIVPALSLVLNDIEDNGISVVAPSVARFATETVEACQELLFPAGLPKVILFPLNHGNHWTTLVCDFAGTRGEPMTFYHLDSLSSPSHDARALRASQTILQAYRAVAAR